jgi:hypothetical protein
MKKAFCKVTTTNHKHYICNYGEPVLYDYKRKEREIKERVAKEGVEAVRSSFSLQRTRTNIKYLVECNVTKNTKFTTLTFAIDPQGRREANKAFEGLYRRYRKRYGEKLPYLWVPERGTDPDGTHRWHIHAILFIDRYITKKDIDYLWPHGFVKINRVDHRKNLALYLMKYITKDALEANKKGYFNSLKLKQPQTYRLPHHLAVNEADCTFIKHYTIPLYNKKGEKIGERTATLYEIPADITIH